MTAWWGCAASVVGAAHVTRREPGQDAAGVWDASQEDAVRYVQAGAAGSWDDLGVHGNGAGRCVGIAVADGHGDIRHPRSGRGALLAVRAAAQVLGPACNGLADHHRGAGLAAAVVDAWRRLVLADLARTPMAEPVDDRQAWVAYGTTLLVAVGTGTSVLLIRVGDGEAGAVVDGGHVDVLPDPQGVGALTASLAGEVTPQVTVIDTAGLSALWLSTDGFSTAQSDANWRDVVAAQLAGRLRDQGRAHVAGNLAGWISPAADDGGDDASLAVLVPPG